MGRDSSRALAGEPSRDFCHIVERLGQEVPIFGPTKVHFVNDILLAANTGQKIYAKRSGACPARYRKSDVDLSVQ